VQVVLAQTGDFPTWLDLTAEVEPLFGPMLNDPRFHQALEKNIRRGTGFCIRRDDGPAGIPLLGAMMFSPDHQPRAYKIGWLAVTAGARRPGVGRALVRHALALAEPAAEIMVKTFTQDAPGGLAARRFYEALGFSQAEISTGPHGEPVQVFRLKQDRLLTRPADGHTDNSV
jgi:ribosomal protein S18 acetylase RimI-like enzyme